MPDDLTAQILTLAPKCTPVWASAISEAMMKAFINTPRRVTMFLAQCAHESGGFTRFVENLNYSAQGLINTWPNRFQNMSIALLYHRDPVRIGNRAYANRLGNGSEETGDGYKYRGRGVIQITGRHNYRDAGIGVDWPLEEMPDDAANPYPGAAVAAWFWRSRGLNELADHADFVGITKKINGGLNGMADREEWLEKAQAILVA